MAINWLKLNDDKTEFIILGSCANLTKVSTEYIIVGEHHIKKSQHVRNIGVIFDASFTMQQQVIKTAQTAWFHLFNISKIRSYLTKEQTQSTIHAYVTSRLDQNNSLLNGILSYFTRRLQKIKKGCCQDYPLLINTCYPSPQRTSLAACFPTSEIQDSPYYL